MNKEATQACQFLASMPIGNTTLEGPDLKELLLSTGGNMFAQGRLYNIKSEHMGVDVYRVTLELANP